MTCDFQRSCATHSWLMWIIRVGSDRCFKIHLSGLICQSCRVANLSTFVIRRVIVGEKNPEEMPAESLQSGEFSSFISSERLSSALKLLKGCGQIHTIHILLNDGPSHLSGFLWDDECLYLCSTKSLNLGGVLMKKPEAPVLHTGQKKNTL